MSTEINRHIEFDDGIPYDEFREKVSTFRDTVLKPRLQKLNNMSDGKKEEMVTAASKSHFTCHSPY